VRQRNAYRWWHTCLLAVVCLILGPVHASDAASVLAPAGGRAAPAIPVTLVADGARRDILAPPTTVGEALAFAGITLGEHDRVAPALRDQVSPNQTITVTRVSIVEQTEPIELPAPILYVEDTTLRGGQRAVRQFGRAGAGERTKVTYARDGVVTLEKFTNERVVEQPVPEIVAVWPGAVPAGALIARTMVATAYEPGPRSCGRHADGITATGVPARRGVIAVDPRVIPLGSTVYVEGYGYALAADVGGAIKGNKIDLCYATVRECLQFGRRKVLMWVVKAPVAGTG